MSRFRRDRLLPSPVRRSSRGWAAVLSPWGCCCSCSSRTSCGAPASTGRGSRPTAVRVQGTDRQESGGPKRAATTTTRHHHAAALPAPPTTGDAVGMIQIPEIGLDRAMVQGVAPTSAEGPRPLSRHADARTDREHRDRGATARPTAPRSSTGRAGPRDQIVVTTSPGRSATRCRPADRVRPKRSGPRPHPGRPRSPSPPATRSSPPSQRLVIKAKLVPAKSSLPVDASDAAGRDAGTHAPTLAEGLDGESKPLGPAYGWGAIVAARRRRVVVAVPPVATPGHLARRRPPVPRRALRLLLLPRPRLPAGC